MTDTVTPIDSALRADPNKLMPEGHTRRRHFFHAGPGVSQDDVRHERFWEKCPRKLARHDLVTVLAEDESWELELCVERVLQNGVHVSVRKVYKRDALDDGETLLADGEFKVDRIAGKGWCVIRRSDGCHVVLGHALKETAIAEWRKLQPRKVA